jgi:hypothetical protein
MPCGAKSRSAKPNLRTCLKEPTRKAVFRSGGGPPEFCYHSLCEDLNLLYHTRRAHANPRSARAKTLEIGDFLRISEPLQMRKTVSRFFVQNLVTACNETAILFDYSNL